MADDNSEARRDTSRPGAWVDVLAPEIIDRFVGRHIAIVHKRVVAAGDSYDEVLKTATELFPDELPYIAYIPKR
ncbi:MAG TPA: DUF5678 domain-containing protein [Capsulimonadaceae bacterium]|jgi:hypothetical protein